MQANDEPAPMLSIIEVKKPEETKVIEVKK